MDRESKDDSFFLTLTQRIFSNWTALRLVVEHDMGSIEDAKNFCLDVANLLHYTEELLTNDEIADYLETYMSEEFQTELEDGSSIEVAEELLRCHRQWLGGDEEAVEREVDKLPPLQPWLNVNVMQFVQPVRRESNNSEDMDIDKTDEQEDGWTVVTNRRNK